MSREKVIKCLVGVASVATLAAGAFFLATKLGYLTKKSPSKPASPAVTAPSTIAAAPASPSSCSSSEPETFLTMRDFDKACSYVRTHIRAIPLRTQIRLYGLYKQATCGDAPQEVVQRVAGVMGGPLTSRAAMKAAWTSEAGLSTEEAERKYMETLETVRKNWRCLTPLSASRPERGYANVVSRPEVEKENPELMDMTEGGKMGRLITKGERAAVLEMLEKEAKTANARDKQKLTPLHWAADSGKKEICEDLLKFGAEISAQDEHGDTPLHMAAVAEEVGVIELLIARGARSDLKNKDGELPENTSGNLKIRQLIKTLFQLTRSRQE